MSVSDQSSDSPKPRQLKLTPARWLQIRTYYETDPNRISLRSLADQFGVGRTTVFKRSAEEHWSRTDALIVQARRTLEQGTKDALREVGAEVSKEIARKALDDLAPWIERKKRRHIKSLVTLGEKGIGRVRKLMKRASPTDAKEEAFISKTADTYDGIVRRNLGMNDASLTGGSLSLRILTGGAAIELQAGNQDHSSAVLGAS